MMPTDWLPMLPWLLFVLLGVLIVLGVPIAMSLVLTSFSIIALDADSTEIAYPVVHAIFESGGEAFLDLGSIGLTELKPGETYLLEDLDSALDVADISKMSIEGTDASGKLGVSAPMTVNP